MKTKQLLFFALSLFLITACSDSDDDYIRSPYSDGVFLLNDGDFSSDPSANLSYLTSSADTLQYRVFEENNPSSKLGETGAFGVFEDELLYVVSKYEGSGSQLVSINASTLVQEQVLNDADFDLGVTRYFAVEDEVGYLSTSTGLFVVDTRSLTVTSKVGSITEGVANVVVEDGYVFVTGLSSVYVLAEKTLDLAKTFAYEGDFGGMVEADDEICFVAGSNLYKIDEDALTMSQHILGANVVSSSFSTGWDGSAYYSSCGSLAYSSKYEKLYYSTSVAQGGNDLRDVYSFDLTTNSVEEVFNLSDENRTLYGAGIGVDPESGVIYLNTIVIGEYVNNTLFEVDPTTNLATRTIAYTGPIYPNTFIFQD